MEKNNPYPVQIGKRVMIEMITRMGIILLLILILGIFIFVFIHPKFGGLELIACFIVVSVLVVPLLLLIGWNYLYLKLLRYECRKDILYFAGGIISKFERNLPYSKIQHAVIYETIWQRIMGISSVSVETARESGGGVFIPDLDKKDAVKLKSYIISKAEKFKSVAGI